MEKGVSKGLMIMVAIAIFSILAIVVTNAAISTEESAGGFRTAICLNTPGLTKDDC